MTIPTARSLFRLAALAVALLPSPLLCAQQLATVTLPDAPTPTLDVAAAVQVSSSTPQATTPPMTEEDKRKAAEAQLQQELHQRMAGVVPNFNAVLNGKALPLSPKQKMRAAFRSAVDPYQFGLAFIVSGFGQATDSHESFDADGTHHGYEQGWAASASAWAPTTSTSSTAPSSVTASSPSSSIRMPATIAWEPAPRRSAFSMRLSTTVVCHGDNGKRQPNYSNILGNIASGGIANLYYPAAERGFGLTLAQGLTVTAEGSFGALLIEFYPDIRRHIHKKHPADPTLQHPTL